MALQLTKTQSNGITTTYHNIYNITWDKDQQMTHYTIASFIDQAHRLAGSDPVCKKLYGQKNTSHLLTETEMYTYIKTLPEFSGSSDL